jgi:hypothetical protein
LQPAHQSDYFRAEGANGFIPEIFRDNRRSAWTPRRVLNDRFVDADTNPVILIEALSPPSDIGQADLDALSRVTAAHAIASAALRGLVNTMLARRGGSPAVPQGSGGV